MAHPHHSTGEIIQRGKTLHQQRLWPSAEAGNAGKVLATNVEAGDCEMDAAHLAASDRAAAKYPGAPLYAMRVGAPALSRLGALAFGRAH